jgi:Lrp/AsnC family transcriptional regulator, leucine-responsive regulatory protein
MNALIGIFISDNGDSDEIAVSLTRIPAVEDCWFVAGEETFVVKVRVPDVAGLEAAIRQLTGIPGVARTRTTVVLSTKFEDRVPADPTH